MNALNNFIRIYSVAISVVLFVAVSLGQQTASYITKFSTPPSIVNSLLYDNGTNIGLGTTSPAQKFHMFGTLRVESPSFAGRYIDMYTSSANFLISTNDFYIKAGAGMSFWTNGVQRAGINSSNGFLGIGTSSPTALLHTVASGAQTANFTGNLLTNTATSSTSSITKYGADVQSTGTWNGASAINIGLHVNATGGTTNYSAIFEGGNFGIGTVSPRAELVIQGAPNTNGSSGSIGALVETYDNTATGSNTTYGGIAFASLPGYDFSVGKKSVNSTTYFQVRRQDGLELLTIDASGNMGLGTTSMGTAKLAVEGKIEAREVVVTSTTPFPDYVFDEGYQVLPLGEVERSIKQNKRLPGVPSAEEIKKKGLNLGDAQVILLKKIEELTLYVIELKKENSSLNNRVSVLEK